MTAVQTLPGIFSISESDPAWDMILRECEERGSLLIESSGGKPFKLETATKAQSVRPKMKSPPDFDAISAKLGDTSLPPAAEAAFFQALRGE